MRRFKTAVRHLFSTRCLSLTIITLVLPLAIMAQDRIEVKGVVKDKDGNPMDAVSVLRKNTNKGTTSNPEGKFTITVGSANATLVFSYVGFTTQEVKLAGRVQLNVVMERAATDQEEVVVIGYGQSTRKDLTGAVGSYKPSQNDATQFGNVDALLRGRVAGVQVQQGGGDPGSPLSIRIRGTNSLRGDNEPLYVVDGIIINNVTADAGDPQAAKTSNSGQSPQNTLSGINPQDIESIEILKDASATAIYGSRGANGVIIITTKQGKSGKPTVQLSSNLEFSRVSKQLKMLDAVDYATYINEVKAQTGQPPVYGLDTLQYTNWQDEMQQTGFTQTYRASLSGASNDSKTKYYLAGGYRKVEGVIQNSGYRMGDIKLNLKQEIAPKLSLDFTLSGQYSGNDMALGPEPLGSSNSSIISKMLSANPITNAQTSLDDPDAYENPFSWLTGYDDKAEEQRLLSRLGLSYKINNIFTYRLNVAADYRNKERKRWFGKETFVGRTANGSLGLSQFNRKYYLIENLLMFNKKFGKDSKIDGTLGVTYDNENVTSSSVLNENFFSEALRTEGFGYGQTLYPYQRYRSGVEIFSGLGRINYSYKSRYIVTLSGRADGSSKFTKGNRFSFFPAVALAWKVSSEKFFSNVESINSLKLRAGYGESGNQAIGPYGTFSQYGQTNYVAGNTIVIGSVPQNIQNKDLTWETTKQFNGGIDLEMFKRRVSLTVDGYFKQTDDLLQTFVIPRSTGFQTIPTNLGTIQNKGIEFTLNTILIEKNDFTWNLGGNLAINRNKIVDLGLPETQFGKFTWEAYLGDKVSNGSYFKDPANIFIVGQPLGMFYGYKTDGVFQKADDISNIKQFGVAVKYGDLKYVDQNADGDITPDDRVILGNPNPKFNYGFNTDFTYKNLNVGVFFNGVYGNQLVNGNRIRIDNPNGINNGNILQTTYDNAWSETNPTDNPRLGSDNGVLIDRYVEDGSFLRLATATIGYTFKFNKTNFFKAINLSVTGRNLLTFTNYTGFDPEVNSFIFSGGRMGIDWNSYPNLRAVTFGINVTL